MNDPGYKTDGTGREQEERCGDATLGDDKRSWRIKQTDLSIYCSQPGRQKKRTRTKSSRSPTSKTQQKSAGRNFINSPTSKHLRI